MPEYRPVDPAFPIHSQIEVEAGPVVLLNVFTFDKADEEAVLRAWEEDSAFMKRQPGFIAAQLHRAVGDSAAFMNYAVWESVGHFRAAFLNPEFRAKIAAYPGSVTTSPHLFQKVAVPGICVA